MISKYVSPPTLPSPPSVPSTSSSSNEEDETERLDVRPLKRSVSNVSTTIPTATITGLPYKRKKSNIFALTTDNGNPMDCSSRHTINPFVTHIHNTTSSVAPVPTAQSKVALTYSRRQQIPSKSSLPSEPKSPFYLNSYSLIKSNHNSVEKSLVEKHRRSSDSTLNRKALRKHEFGDMSGIHMGRPENAIQNGEIPGLNNQMSPDDPKAVTIHQHYYPEGHWGWVLTICVCFAHFFTSVLTPSSGFFIIDTISHFQIEDGIFSAGMAQIIFYFENRI